MPLHYQINVSIDKVFAPKEKQEFSDEEKSRFQKMLQSELRNIWDQHETVDAGFGPVIIRTMGIHFVSPLRPLSDIVVGLPELRQELALQMAQGTDELTLDDLLILIRTVYRNSRG